MQVSSTALRARIAIWAGGLLTAACATVAPAPLTPQLDLARMASQPAPRSTLVSRPDLRFSVARELSAASDTNVLVYEPSQGVRVPVAVVVATNSREGADVAIQRLPLPAVHGAALDVAVIEHLYVLAVQQDGRARFCLSAPGERCDAAKAGESHAMLLRQLVEARQRALLSAHDVRLPWQVVSMAPVAAPAGSAADQVAVRVTTDDRPLAGAHVAFSRAPHSGCVARSDAQGLAMCDLIDYHGDDGDEGEDRVPIVATFAGDVRADRALVPTTAVVPPREPQAVARGGK